MEGWMECARRLQTSSDDTIAAAMAFGFVFVHPLEDCNGPIHYRSCLHELARSEFAPPKPILQVPAVMCHAS